MDTIAQLRRIFLQERSVFLRSYPHVADAGLRLRRFKRHTARDCAMASPAKLVVYFHPDALETLTPAQVTALVRHELAHLCDPDLTETETDALAEIVSGRKIYYGRDLIQTTKSPGYRPRPPELPD